MRNEPAARPPARLVGATWALIGLGFLLVATFDVLGPNLAYNDDWGFAWSTWHSGFGGLRLYPGDSALALPQILLGMLASLAGHDRRLLRASTLPFLALLLLVSHRLARRAGADRAWAAVAALAPLAFPILAADATSYMTDVPYAGLELAALAATVVGLESRRWWWAAATLCLVATSERQIGVLLPGAMAVGLVVSPARRDVRRWVGVAAALVASAALLVGLTAGGITPPTNANRLAAAAAQQPVYALTAVLFAPSVAGLGLAVFLPGLIRRGPRSRLAGPLTAGLLLWEAVLAAVAGLSLFPGNVLTPWSFAWTWLGHAKSPIFPLPVFLALDALAVAAAAALTWRAARSQVRIPAANAVLIAGALLQFLPLLGVHYLVLDRYYIPVVAPLVPLAAAAASGPGVRRVIGALAIGAAGLLLYAVGEQDYIAWQAARDTAAHLAYARADPLEVNAGYEANAVYGEVPYYERTGRQLGSLADPGAHDFSGAGPDHPVIVLTFAGVDDPRPGVVYRSLAPGKIVLETSP